MTDLKAPKNIVICMDGTGNEFGDTNSNVIKLLQTLVRDERQVVYYHPGLGTAGELDPPTLWGSFKTKLRKIAGLAFGYGLVANVARAYNFLMDNYEPGDRLYVFGFSRGAYSARVLCSIIYCFGVLNPGDDVMVDYAIKLLLQWPSSKKIAQKFAKVFGRDCKPHLLGVWDTVSSVGWFRPMKIPFTRNNPEISVIRHAVSIDERRIFFRTNLLGAPKPNQDFKEVWFAGVHADVGGSYPEAESGLSKISLKWMLEEAQQTGLLLSELEKAAILGGTPEYVAPDPLALIHNESRKLGWRLAEFLPMLEFNEQTKKNQWVFWRKRSAPRLIPIEAVIHESALIRMKTPEANYHPANVPS